MDGLKDNLWNSDPSGGSLLDFAKWNGNPEIIQILVDAGAKATEQVTVVEEGHFPEAVEERYPTTASGLYGAVADGDVAAVRRLVEAGVDVDAKAAGGESILNNAVIRAGPEIVQVLVDGGANVNAEDNLGRSVLYEAAEFDPDPEVVRVLVDAGADVNFKYEYGDPILFEAATGFDPNPEIVRILVDAGADVNARDRSGTSALKAAKGRGNLDVARILTEAGAVE